jgi:hypothetical protein
MMISCKKSDCAYIKKKSGISIDVCKKKFVAFSIKKGCIFYKPPYKATREENHG